MIDLRSDTVTTPTEAMWQAMREATLGDDTLEGDPTVARLETLAAKLTGKPAALFVTSGTMGNVISALTHNQRGGLEAIVDSQAHMLLSEAGAYLAWQVCFVTLSPLTVERWTCNSSKLNCVGVIPGTEARQH